VRSGLGRTLVLLIGGALAQAGWATVFPFLYADISTARGLGGFVAAGTFTAFAVGSIAAAPVGGWLADRPNPTLVASTSRVALAVSIVALAYAPTPATIWAAAVAFGVSLALAVPAIQVILLARTPARRRRDVFAWQFIAINIGAAGGAAVGGSLVDLSSQAAMLPVYLLAAAAALVSAVVVAAAGWGAHSSGLHGVTDGNPVTYRMLFQNRAIRWLIVVALLITLACYAQYDAGLPAYVLDSMEVSPGVLGSAIAGNMVLVALLTAPVVAFTRRKYGTTLLALCALMWALCWLVFGVPLVVHGHDALFVFLGFAALSFGETMMAPILSPLAASLAPEGAAGRTMAAVTGATTIATAIGPILSGVLLGAGVPAAFIALQVVICLATAVASVRLSALLRHRVAPRANSPRVKQLAG